MLELRLILMVILVALIFSVLIVMMYSTEEKCKAVMKFINNSACFKEEQDTGMIANCMVYDMGVKNAR